MLAFKSSFIRGILFSAWLQVLGTCYIHRVLHMAKCDGVESIRGKIMLCVKYGGMTQFYVV